MSGTGKREVRGANKLASVAGKGKTSPERTESVPELVLTIESVKEMVDEVFS